MSTPGTAIGKFDIEAFKYLNDYRADPALAVTDLTAWLDLFEDGEEKIYTLYPKDEDKDKKAQTAEMVVGKSAINNAITFLNSQSAVNEIDWEDGLFQACLDHVEDIGSQGLAYDTSDSTVDENNDNVMDTTVDRILRYGTKADPVEELFFEGKISPKYMVLSLIVSDQDYGNANANRAKFYANNVTKGAIATGKHKTSDSMSYLNLVGDFTVKQGFKLDTPSDYKTKKEEDDDKCKMGDDCEAKCEEWDTECADEAKEEKEKMDKAYDEYKKKKFDNTVHNFDNYDSEMDPYYPEGDDEAAQSEQFWYELGMWFSLFFGSLFGWMAGETEDYDYYENESDKEYDFESYYEEESEYYKEEREERNKNGGDKEDTESFEEKKEKENKE